MNFVPWYSKLDKWLGRGSYYWLRSKLDPERTYFQWEYADILERIVTPHTSWLDGGCGHQILEVRLKEQERRLVDRAEFVVGCDPFFLSISKHRSITNRVMCSLDDLPFLAGSFNLVTMNMVVEHLADPAKVFQEIARVLKPGGIVIFVTPNRASYYVRLADLARAIIPRRIAFKLIRYLESREPEDVFPTHYRANTRKRVERIMCDVGMERVQMTFMRGRPFFFFFAPLSILEMLAVRFLALLGFQETISAGFMAVYASRTTGISANSSAVTETLTVPVDRRGL